jgi:signal transduction histidine kinase/PAS domain-containing protein
VKTPIKLLYLEDDGMDRRAFLRMVREKALSYEVTVAETLAEARAHLAGSRFDVMLVDYHLPDGHCTELFDEIQDTPVILMTGTLEEQLALRTLERGIDDYLVKDPQQRHLDAVPSMVEKTLYRQFLRQREQQLTRELHESEQFRGLAMAAGGLGTWDWNPATGEVLWDERCFAILGVSPGPSSYSDVINKLVHPSDAAMVDAAVKRAFAPASDGNYEIEYRVLWPDRSVHWVAARGQAIFEGEGESRKATRFIGTVMDITERKQAEAEVAALRDRLAADLADMKRLHELSTRLVSQDDLHGLMEATLDAAIAITGANKGNVQLLTPSSGELGIAVHRGFDQAFVEFFSHIRAGQVACGTAMQTRQCVVVEDITLSPLFLNEPRALQLKLAAGVRAIACTPLLTRTGQLVGVLSVHFAAPHRPSERELRLLDLLARQGADFISEMAERKRAQQILEQSAEELKRSNRDLEAFAYVASHDLQEPLRAVGGYAKLLERSLADKLDSKELEHLIGTIEGAARMERLINDLLAYSRVGATGGPLISADLNAVLQDALRNLQAATRQSQATITHDSLPTVAADSAQITQLFQNLIGNAIKFCNPRRPEIHIGARKESGRWIISVRDNGIGIAPENFKRVFQIFQRLHTREKYPGTGVGLAICQRIVERHGGDIWVESQPGQGSTFYFSLPEFPRVAKEPKSV